MTDIDSHNEMLRKRAYAIWEAEGHPFGRDSFHWDQAVAEFGSEPAVAPDTIAAPAEKKPPVKRANAVPKV